MAKKASSKKSAAPRAKKASKPVAVKSYRKNLPAREPQEEVVPRLVKTPLSKTELAQFRQLLLNKRRGIIGDLSGIQAEAIGTNRQDGSGDLSNMPTHPADIGTDNFEQEFTLGLLESERQLLKEIDEALDRIKNHTFGICLGTGKFIGKARLEARPWAKYCIDYAKQIEKGTARPAESRPAQEAEEETEEVEVEEEEVVEEEGGEE